VSIVIKKYRALQEDTVATGLQPEVQDTPAARQSALRDGSRLRVMRIQPESEDRQSPTAQPQRAASPGAPM